MPVYPSTWTPDHLAALERAYASGVTEVSFADRRIRYASMADLLRAINEIRGVLQANAQGAVRSRITRVITARGA